MLVFDLERDLDPIDQQQLEILAKMPPEDRVVASLAATEWVLAGLRGALHERFPGWSQRRINLEALARATPLRGARIREFIEHELDFVLHPGVARP